MDIFELYQKLRKIYGKQGWWPLKLDIKKVKDLSFSNCREEFGLCYGIPYKDICCLKSRYRDPYFEVAVGAILTQNTSWKNVARAMCNLHSARLVKPELILFASNSQVEKSIKPSGYYRQKSKKLKIFSKWLLNNYSGNIVNLTKEPVEKTRKELLSIWGLGPETADSILLYALNKPVFVVDVYTKRLFAKFNIGKENQSYDYYKQLTESSMPKSVKTYREFHALIVASGKDKHSKI